MPFLMRTVRKGRWHQQDWLPVGEPPADALADISTQSNELSVWLIEDDRSNLNRVAAALAAARDSVSNLDYRLVPVGWVGIHRIPVQATEGRTADLQANQKWHRDIPRLTASRLLSLARCMWRRGVAGRISERRVEELLLSGLRTGQLGRERLNQKLAAKLVPPEE
jgi:hypothetical protein